MRNKENSFAFLNALNGSNALMMDKKHWKANLEKLIDTKEITHVIGFEDPQEFEDKMRNAEWENYEHEFVQPGYAALRTFDIKGMTDQINLDDLNDNYKLILNRTMENKYMLLIPGKQNILEKRIKSNSIIVIMTIAHEIEIIHDIIIADDLSYEFIDKLENTSDLVLTASRAKELGFTKAIVVT